MVSKVILLLALSALSAAAEDTAPAHDDGPAPAPAPHVSLGKLFQDNVNQELHRPDFKVAGHEYSFQFPFAIVMMMFAVFMVWDGQVAFKYVMTSGAGLLMYFVAASQISLTLGDQLGPNLCFFAAVEMGLLAFLVVQAGWAVVQYALGAIIGYCLSGWVLAKVAYHVGDAAAKNQWFILVNWNICILIGLFLLHGGRLNKIVLTVLMSFTGGLMLAGSCSYFFNYAASFAQTLAVGQVRGGFWIDYVGCIFDSNNKDVGYFASRTDLFVTPFNTNWYMDCLLGRLAWFAFFVAGCIISWKVHPAMENKKKAAAADPKEAARAKAKSKAKGGCFAKLRGNADKSEPLLG